MMSNFNKPNYIDEKFLEATNQGWIDTRTGEILVAIPYLSDRLKAISPVRPIEVNIELEKEKVIEEVITEVDSEETDSEIEKIVNEEVPKVEETVEPVKKRRGRPAKVKEA